MREKILWAAIGAGIMFAVEEVRAFRFMAEAGRRQSDSSIRLASLTERIEMLEA